MIRSTSARSEPLPPLVVAALASASAKLRNVPRCCIHDPAELIHFLRRVANEVDGIKGMTVPAALPAPKALPPRTRLLTAREKAEVVFGKVGQATAPIRPEQRNVITRRGRSVRVEVRRRSTSQMEMNF